MVSWVVNQCKGIASGLSSIHNFHSKCSADTRGQYEVHCRHSKPEHIPEQSSDDGIYGRHGDIKPENILWFNGPHEGMLKIADFGLTDFRSRTSRSYVNPRSVACSPTYAPPEIALDMPISRAYDIWSLGCVYLEFVIWLMGGVDLLETAGHMIRGDSALDQGFYSISGSKIAGKKQAFLKDSVRQCIKDLSGDSRCSDFVREMLGLIEHSMLVIDPKKRKNAKDVAEALQNMLDRMQTDPDYLSKEIPSQTSCSVATKEVKRRHTLLGRCSKKIEKLKSVVENTAFAKVLHRGRKSESNIQTLCTQRESKSPVVHTTPWSGKDVEMKASSPNGPGSSGNEAPIGQHKALQKSINFWK